MKRDIYAGFESILQEGLRTSTYRKPVKIEITQL
jgi:hypothetical protein